MSSKPSNYFFAERLNILASQLLSCVNSGTVEQLERIHNDAMELQLFTAGGKEQAIIEHFIKCLDQIPLEDDPLKRAKQVHWEVMSAMVWAKLF